MTRTVITLRARFCGDPPRPGELMAAATGATVYRVEAVTTLRRAGAEHPQGHRYRLTCARLEASEVPQDIEIHPWRWGSRAPRRTVPQAASVPWVAPSPKPAQRAPSRRSEAHTGGGDFGPGLRRRAIRDHRGRYIRDADVEVSDEREGDPDYPNRRVRRARRVDIIDLLCRDGTIGQREVEAAGALRKALEQITPVHAGGTLVRVDTSPHLRVPIGPAHVSAAAKIRDAAAALGGKLWQPVLWVCSGGTVRGYAAERHVGTNRAAALVGDGLTKLADCFYGRAA